MAASCETVVNDIVSPNVYETRIGLPPKVYFLKFRHNNTTVQYGIVICSDSVNMSFGF